MILISTIKTFNLPTFNFQPNKDTTMTKYQYHLVDVFTDRPFAGNQLAVLTDGRGISPETMQAIAREFNLSETTFVLPPEDSTNNYHVRIFTPGAELPMA